jgi:uncharacterized membrane protein YcfT
MSKSIAPAIVRLVPTPARAPRRALGIPTLLKVTLLALAGAVLALALTDPGLAG